jgi:hypothetical protein
MSKVLDVRRVGRFTAVVALLWCVCWVLVPAGAGATPVAATPLGIEQFSVHTTRERKVPAVPGEYEAGEPEQFTQAGGHPWALTTVIRFTSEQVNSAGVRAPTRDTKNNIVDLPPGLLGNPLAVPRCALRQALETGTNAKYCPIDTQVGVGRIKVNGSPESEVGPLVSVVPEEGQSAEFGLENRFHLTFKLVAHLVHTAQGYGITVVGQGIPLIGLTEIELTFWGVPADPSHDTQRGLFCYPYRALNNCDYPEGGDQKNGAVPAPFLTMPADCAAGPETATLRADSWQEPVRYENGVIVEGKYAEASSTLPAATGCNQLAFHPTIGIDPDTQLADSPVGLGVSLGVPLNEEPQANATPQLRNSTVTLPEGMSVSPGIVDGIQACNEYGPEGIDITRPPVGPDESEEVGVDGELQLAPGHCPDASIVGTAEAITPLLPIPVKGHVYLARPGCGGPGQAECTEADVRDGKLYRLYLELGGTGELAKTSVHFKVALENEVNPATGQITARTLGTPQTPFSELRIHLNGGPRAALDNPAACGPAVTSADFTPWSAPGTTPEGLLVVGTPDATPSSFYNVDLAGDGLATPCPTLPFNPGFVAGTVIPNAGKFSAFTMNIARKDREQFVKGVQVHTPPGLLAMLSSVPLCPDAQANAGACSATSKIGTTRVASGAGSHPFEIEGTIYLTGPHDGAPFGLSIVTRAVAGPFNLGLVVVRARIDIDPENSTATVTTDETGPYALPQIIFGVPLRLQRITVNIDRPGFMFNPTNCAAQQVTVRISGSQEAVANVSSPFAVGNCTSLAFKPTFTVSTNGKTSRAKGASLDAKLSYPKNAMGADANIAKVKVSLPKQLPSYLPTLQKACLAATFNANPATCPAGSVVGIARASTPLLPVGLSGPVYFVSHGGEEFPSLIIVLQGDGVRVDLTGSTFIDKAGVTSSTFKTIPDVPVNTFELYLPQGKGHALAANTNLCKVKGGLKMPTTFTAQNGAVVNQSTQVKVTGCTKPKKAKSGRRAK